MNCDIIKDLIPLSAEGLCSEESEKQIAEHIRTCESCRILYETSSENEPPVSDVPTPDEEEVFRKVNRRIKKLTWKSWLIGGVLIILVGVLGILSAGQLLKNRHIPSFETIFQNYEAKKYVKYLENCDFEGYIAATSKYFDTSGFTDSFYLKKNSRDYDANLLKETYEAAYGDTRIVKAKCYTGYVNDDDTYIATTVVFRFADGREHYMFLRKGVDGKFHMTDMSFVPDTDTPENRFSNAISFVNWHKVDNMVFTEILYNKNSELSAEDLPWRYQTAYREQVREKRNAFYSSDFDIDTVYFSHVRFDEEAQMYYYDVTAKTHDSEGNATATTRLYLDYMGMIPPERSTVNVCADGCTPELEEMMYDFFG